MNHSITRRSFVRNAVLSSTGVALALNARAEDAKPSEAAPSEVPATLPKAKIGKLEVSRLILGGNLLTHFTHSRDLQ